jgi:hypothetical protein
MATVTKKKSSPLETKPGGLAQIKALFVPYKNEWILFGLVAVITWLLLLFAYPYLTATPDSGSYVSSAKSGIIGFRPFGYSLLIRWVHNIHPSMTALISAQYLLHTIACGAFIFTCIAVFSLPARKSLMAGILLLLLSPASLHLSTTLLSDSAFATGTLLYITSLIWMVYFRQIGWVFVHIFILFCTLYLRFTAIAYVPVSIFIFFLTIPVKWKALFYSSLLVLTAYVYYQNTVNQYTKAVQVKIFSPFGGWQMLNNALHVYPEGKLDPNKVASYPLKDALAFINLFPDSSFAHTGSHYMWAQYGPLKQYLFRTMNQKNWIYFKGYTYVGKIYNDLGIQIIFQNPLLFFKKFILPSLKTVFWPKPATYFTPFLPEDAAISNYFQLDEKTKYEPRMNVFKPLSSWVSFTNFIAWLLTAMSCIFLFLQRTNLHAKVKTLYISVFLLVLAFIGINILSGIVEARYLTAIHGAQLLFILGACIQWQPTRRFLSASR